MAADQAIEGDKAGTDRDEWRRHPAGWHAAFVGLVVLTAGLTSTTSDLDARGRAAAVGLVAVLAGWYAIAGVRGLRREPGWAGPGYLVVAAPVTVAVFALVPVGALLLVALYPHIWIMLAPRRAVVVTCAVVSAVAVVILAQRPVDGVAVATVLLFSVVSFGVALALGLWIARIVRQSRQRAALVAQLHEARAELATVSREAGALAERERLSLEIHDTLAQGFTSVLLLLEAAQAALPGDPDAAAGHLARARDTARDNLAEARALVAALAPPALVDTSLPEALRRLVARLGPGAGPRAELTVTGTPRALSPEHEVALLRMAQESLTNVRRHAGATRAEVTLAYLTDRVSMRISDDGKGFDPAEPHPGYGLAGIHARAQGIGGAVTVQAAPGDGVVIRVDVPTADGGAR